MAETSGRHPMRAPDHPWKGAPTAGRDCGTCIACCEILKIDKPELKKPARVLCQHNTGSGCGIYNTRPDVCRTWYCLWRLDPTMPDEARPDRLGVVFAVAQHLPPRFLFEREYVVGWAINGDDDFKSPLALNIIQAIADHRALPVFLSHDGTKRRVWPDVPLADAIQRPFETPFQTLVPEAMVWRRRYGLDG